MQRFALLAGISDNLHTFQALIMRSVYVLFYRYLPVIMAALFALNCGDSPPDSKLEKPQLYSESLAYHWASIALECTARDTDLHGPRPTITSRSLALTFTAVYDAWTRFDDRAIPVYLDKVMRWDGDLPMAQARNIAISYAAARTLYTYYPESRSIVMRFMNDLELDFNDYTLDPEEAAGIGNLAARTLIESRRNDLSNQFNTPSYQDFTGYQPTNSWNNVVSPEKWYPKPFVNAEQDTFFVDCLTPHWHWVTPFALERASDFRPGPPPAIDSDQLRKEVMQVIDYQARLSDEDRALVEFMRDGPSSVQQAGHWLIFAQHLSKLHQHGVDRDVPMYFVVTNAALDAFIACWDAKMHFDFARPQALVHTFHAANSLYGWMGEGRGWGMLLGSEWRPYSPANFLCPPFPSYPSGHSSVSSACASVLKKFTGSDEFNYSITLIPGALTEPENTGEPITLTFATLSETAEAAGKSRVLGGYHIATENTVGLDLGEKVADRVWSKYFSLRNGLPVSEN